LGSTEIVTKMKKKNINKEEEPLPEKTKGKIKKNIKVAASILKQIFG
jgi:hypothetical protein